MLFSRGRWIFWVVALYSLIAPAMSVQASSPGLAYQTFIGTGAQPPLPLEDAVPLSSGTVPWIAHNWGGGQVLDSGRHDGVIVRYEGWILPPDLQTYYICANSDDGFRLYLDGVLVIDDWYDRGGGCGQTADVDFANGQPKHLVAYFYENGGGAAAFLTYYLGDGGWGFVPQSWYTLNEPTPATTTTTTLAPFLGAPTGVTVSNTDSGVFIDWDAPLDSVNISPERYAISWSNGQSGWGVATGNVGSETALNTEILLPYEVLASSSGLGIELSFSVRSDNDSLGIYSVSSAPYLFVPEMPPPPTTTTSTTTTTTTVAPETTTTTEPEPWEEPTTSTPLTTIGTTTAPTTDAPVETDPPVTEPEITEPPTTDPETTEPPTTEPNEPIEDSIPEEITDTTGGPIATDPDESEATVPESTPDSENEEEAPTPEEIVAEIDDPELAAQVLEILTADDISAEQIVALLENDSFDDLTDEQLAAVADALNDESDEVKEAFEDNFNVFGGGVDNYIPSGSTVTVGQRRIIIAATSIIVIAPVAVAGSSGGGRRRGN